MLFAQAPSFQWGKPIGGSLDEHANSVATDASGNVFTVGKYSGTVDFDPGVGVSSLTSTGVFDVFITKTDANGNFVWVKSVGNLYGSEDAYAIKLDASGNIFICGVYYNNCDMDPGSGSTVLSGLTSPVGGVSSLNDSFLLKLDPNGNFLWARALAKSVYNASPRWSNYANSLAIDDLGNVIVVGYFTGRTLIADTVYYQANTTGAGTAADIFIMKYSSTGVIQWATQIGSNTNESPTSIVANASGIYITGHFNGVLDFDPNTTVTANLTPTGGYDSFLLKLNASGNFVWVKKTNGAGDEYGRSLAINAAGDLFWGGNYTGSFDFDPTAGVTNLTSAGNTDNFITKMDTSGNYYWTYGFGGVNGDYLSSISLDSQNNVYATGNFSGTVDFDSGSGTSSFTSNGGPDIYIEKISNAGVFVWTWAFGGQSLGGTIDVGSCIVMDNSNNLVLVGDLYGSADVWLDPNFTTGSRITPNGAYDGFMLKMQSGTLSSNDFILNAFKLYPNPSNGIYNLNAEIEANYSIVNTLGQVLHKGKVEFGSNVIDIQNQPNGLYFIQFNEGKALKIIKE
jgi:hypothetical protein